MINDPSLNTEPYLYSTAASFSKEADDSKFKVCQPFQLYEIIRN